VLEAVVRVQSRHIHLLVLVVVEPALDHNWVMQGLGLSHNQCLVVLRLVVADCIQWLEQALDCRNLMVQELEQDCCNLMVREQGLDCRNSMVQEQVLDCCNQLDVLSAVFVGSQDRE